MSWPTSGGGDSVPGPAGEVEDALGIGAQDVGDRLDEVGPGRDALILLDVVEIGGRDLQGAGQLPLADPVFLAEPADVGAERGARTPGGGRRARSGRDEPQGPSVVSG